LRPEHRIVKTFPSANREIPMVDPTPTINRTWGSLVVLSSRRPVCHVLAREQRKTENSSSQCIGRLHARTLGVVLERKESLREREGEIRRRVKIRHIESSYRPSCVTTVLSTACIHWQRWGGLPTQKCTLHNPGDACIIRWHSTI
jgi:hypothetical protein